MDLEEAFLDSEGALLHSLPKNGGPWPLWSPVPTSLTVAISGVKTTTLSGDYKRC